MIPDRTDCQHGRNLGDCFFYTCERANIGVELRRSPWRAPRAFFGRRRGGPIAARFEPDPRRGGPQVGYLASLPLAYVFDCQDGKF